MTSEATGTPIASRPGEIRRTFRAVILTLETYQNYLESSQKVPAPRPCSQTCLTLNLEFSQVSRLSSVMENHWSQSQ